MTISVDGSSLFLGEVDTHAKLIDPALRLQGMGYVIAVLKRQFLHPDRDGP